MGLCQGKVGEGILWTKKERGGHARAIVQEEEEPCGLTSRGISKKNSWGGPIQLSRKGREKTMAARKKRERSSDGGEMSSN